MKRFQYVALVLLGLVSITIIICDETIQNATKRYLYTDTASIPYHKVGLVLGTARYAPGGGTNLYFTRRVRAVADLFQANKISFVIVSGDNGTTSYNEPQDMKDALMNFGIPESKIFLDCAGFRTYDSVIRARDIFGQTDITIISQPFHNERSIYIARNNDIRADGYNAEDVVGYNSTRTKTREKFARVKVFLDMVLGTKPKFLGEKITIQ